MRKVLLLILLIPAFSIAQNNEDFGIWAGGSATYKVNKELKLDGGLQVRTHENSTRMRTVFAQFGGKYKFNKYFNAGVFWRPRVSNRLDGPQFQNRFHLDLTGRYKLNDVTFYLRNRSQMLFKPNDVVFYDRIRLKTKVKLQKGLSAFIQDEFFIYLNNYSGPVYDKNRFAFGMEYGISKELDINLKYLRITEVGEYNPLTMNVVSIGLEYNL